MDDLWDITITPYVDTTSVLCLIRLRGRIDRHPSQGQTNPHTRFGIDSYTVCNNPLPAPNYVDNIRFKPKELLGL